MFKGIGYEDVKASGIWYLYLKGLITTTALTITRSSSSSNSERSITRLSKDPSRSLSFVNHSFPS